jgi:hypothetical protein
MNACEQSIPKAKRAPWFAVKFQCVDVLDVLSMSDLTVRTKQLISSRSWVVEEAQGGPSSRPSLRPIVIDGRRLGM